MLTPHQKACLRAVVAAPQPVRLYRARTVATLERLGYVTVATQTATTAAVPDRFWIYPTGRAVEFQDHASSQTSARRRWCQTEDGHRRPVAGTTHDPAVLADRVARWVYAQELRNAGHTLEDIGRTLGVTRERVRQKTTVPGHVPSDIVPGADVARLLACVRDPATMSTAPLVAIRGDARRVLTRMGRWDAAVRLFRWRRTAPRRRYIAGVIQGEFRRHGRTPTLLELSVAFGVGPTAAAPMLVATFGSVRAAMEYAGVPHRSVHATGAAKFAHGIPQRARPRRVLVPLIPVSATGVAV